MTLKQSVLSPARVLLGTILITISGGAALLALPLCRTTEVPFLDLLFTATSATTVTGLNTIPLDHFTRYGHSVIMLLMQIGGLGLITLMLFMVSLFVNVGFGTQLIMGKILELDTWKNIKRLLLFIIGFTLVVEFLGACCIFFAIKEHYTLSNALFLSIFHAVSAFCNAGFSLFPHGLGFMQTNPFLLSITSLLILAGGLGFLTWHELYIWLQTLKKKRRHTFTLQSKIVMYATALLTGSGLLLYWILERNNTLAHDTWFLTLLNSLLNSLSARSAGFVTIPTSDLHLATLLVFMVMAFIGSSPASTGSGVKTTTFAIFLSTVRSALYARPSIEIQGRRIAQEQVYKALAIITLSICWIFFATFCLLITEKGWEFLDILFEVVSAFATLGLSLGVTPYLTPFGKLLIMLTMVIGRIGSMTAVLALQRKIKPAEYEYPEERVMLG
ncbi:MAG: TrkH family potassium uptake protein [Candidatus Babeliales bacterium]